LLAVPYPLTKEIEMFCIGVTYIVKEGFEEKAIEFLKIMTGHTRQEPGNIMYVAHQFKSDPRKFFLYEQYHQESDLDVHRNAAYFKEYVVNGLLPILESRTPEVLTPLS
jgi:quinol monooxygenase YgiN